MRLRIFFTFAFLSLVAASVVLSFWSIWSWVSSWNDIFTGAQLISPMGCDCGISISFWQHPYVYTLGLAATSLLFLLTAWVLAMLARSWKKTQGIVRSFHSAHVPIPVEEVFLSLRQHIFPAVWPRPLLPRLRVIQDSSPKALSAGFLSSQVIISTGTLNQVPEEELRAILTHELMHVRNLDPLFLWCTTALSTLFPPPGKSSIQQRLHEYVECKTDHEAASVVGSVVLGKALLRVVSWQEVTPLAGAVQMRGAVETRLKILAGWSERPEVPWKSILSLGAWLIAVIFGATLALQHVGEVYAQEVNSPACLEVESVVYVDDTLVLICPELPMSVE